jgi:hypothetical protein
MVNELLSATVEVEFEEHEIRARLDMAHWKAHHLLSFSMGDGR